MVKIERKTRVLEGISADAIPYEMLMREERPTILKGVAKVGQLSDIHVLRT